MGTEISEKDKIRSNFYRDFIQREKSVESHFSEKNNTIPRIIVQYWDNMDLIPDDVFACIETWRKLEKIGFKRKLFDKNQAIEYIKVNYTKRHLEAFNRCYHPAMESDYFRLCYILFEGGCYIDADDEYNGEAIDNLFNDDRLKIQPLCYDIQTNSMVSPKIFTKPNEVSPGWIFYFNNNPIIASAGNTIIYHALERATSILLENTRKRFPEIQSTTGPGNLTETIYKFAITDYEIVNNIQILNNWEDIATSKWPLSYRDDSRNWRHSNSIPYQR